MPALPASDWSGVRIYPRFLRPIGPSQGRAKGVEAALLELLSQHLKTLTPVGPNEHALKVIYSPDPLLTPEDLRSETLTVLWQFHNVHRSLVRDLD
eukprot:8544722-Pyramimonas_sp.AAC.1